MSISSRRVVAAAFGGPESLSVEEVTLPEPGPREVHGALRYVLLNARRRAAIVRKKLDARIRLDPASSGRWFDGWKRKAVGTEAGSSTVPRRPPVSRARTWLLSVAWRRYGLLDPADVPG